MWGIMGYKIIMPPKWRGGYRVGAQEGGVQFVRFFQRIVRFILKLFL